VLLFISYTPIANASFMCANSLYHQYDSVIDWEYAKDVWVTKRTYGELMQEDAKYSEISDPWINKIVAQKSKWSCIYPDDVKKFRETLGNSKKDMAKKRGYDLQFIYGIYQNHVYEAWKKDFKAGKTSKTFEQILKDHSKGSCEGVYQRGTAKGKPIKMFTECFFYPDWRTPEQKASEPAFIKQYKQQNKKLFNDRAKADKANQADYEFMMKELGVH